MRRFGRVIRRSTLAVEKQRALVNDFIQIKDKLATALGAKEDVDTLDDVDIQKVYNEAENLFSTAMELVERVEDLANVQESIFEIQDMLHDRVK